MLQYLLSLLLLTISTTIGNNPTLLTSKVSTKESSVKSSRYYSNLTSRGLSRNKTLVMNASAYYAGPGIQGGPKTATGHAVKPGVIAVDPRVIPLYTKVYIQSPWYTGYATALDTGGMIKGNKIDIAMSNRAEAYKFGRRRVRVTILPHDYKVPTIPKYKRKK
jgi:3D (Asp-Asp-Asp) domain-containing protein